MSGLLAGKVWHSDLDADLKPLAATLADIGDDDGSSIYPSVGFVCWRLGRSDSCVRDGMRKLREIGVLEVVEPGGGRHKPTEYRMVEDKLPKRPKWGNPPVKLGFPQDEKSSSLDEKPSGLDEKPSGLAGQTLRPTGTHPSLPVIEPSGSAPFSSHVNLQEQQKTRRQNGADSRPLIENTSTKIRAEIFRMAKRKDLARMGNSHRNPQVAHLESGIYRHHVSAAYFDSIHGGLLHEQAFREAFDQAVRSLMSNRGAVELRGIKTEALQKAAWPRLAPYVETFAGIGDYQARQNQVVGVIVRVVAEAALALQRPSESSHASQSREAVEVQSFAAVG